MKDDDIKFTVNRKIQKLHKQIFCSLSRKLTMFAIPSLFVFDIVLGFYI